MAQSNRMSATMLLVSALAAGLVGAVPAQAAGDGEIAVTDFAEIVESAQLGSSSRDGLADARSATSDMTAVEDCLTADRDGDLNVWRHAGENRWETAACVSGTMWAAHDDPDPEAYKAQAVVLARGDRYEDALSSGPLAAWVQAPLLLTRPTSLPDVVRDEIDRVLAPGGLIYVIGGPSAVSQEVQDEMDDAGYVTQRIAGADRYETAVEVTKELPDTSNFFFATGRNFPDALGAGTAAAALTVSAREEGGFEPYGLLLTGDDTLRSDVAEFVLERGIQFGEWSLVTAGVQAEQAVAGAFDPESIAASFSGSDRYDTAAQIAEGVFTHPDTGELLGWGVGLSTGINFPDALAATPYLAEFGQPLLLVRPNFATWPTTNFLEAHAGEGGIPGEDRWVDVFGGENAVHNSTLNDAVQSFK